MEKILRIYREQRSYKVETVGDLHQGYKKFDNLRDLLNYLETCEGQLDQYRLEVSEDLQETVTDLLNKLK